MTGIALMHIVSAEPLKQFRNEVKNMHLEVRNVKKSYGEGGSFAQVLSGISISVNRGDMCVIQDTSGSGKSTLLNCIGGLDLMDSGSIQVDGKEIFGLT